MRIKQERNFWRDGSFHDSHTFEQLGQKERPPVLYERELEFDQKRCNCKHCSKIEAFMLERLPRGPDGNPLVSKLEIRDGREGREHAESTLRGLSWETCYPPVYPVDLHNVLSLETVK